MAKHPDNYSLPSTGFVREHVVLRHVPVARSTWWDGIKAGRYPKPVKLSARAIGWRAEDIHALIKQLSEQSQQPAAC